MKGGQITYFLMIFQIKTNPGLKIITKKVDEKQFVDIQNQYGGFVYAGGTMAFTALYWALGTIHLIR